MDLHYGIRRTPRRQSIEIQVYPDLEIDVLAPNSIGAGEIAMAVERRRRWIEKQCAFFRTYHPLPSAPRFVAGETHYLLGRQYRLRIAERMPSTMVGVVGEYIEVLLRSTNSREAVQRALKSWYLVEAKRVLTKELDCAAKVMRKHGVNRPEFKLREMAGRWGSCTRSGVLMLNPILVRVPIHCIRYVLLHELCHLRHHDHGAEFYRLLGRALPDWVSGKRALERWAEVLPVSDRTWSNRDPKKLRPGD
jgi:predicted metal-dependent hydrolase